MQERASRADIFVRIRKDGEEELTEFKDLFSRGAAEYAVHRPRYPWRLFAELAAHAPRRELAWDCATGNGQAAIGLAEHVRDVVATDASSAQIAAAIPSDRVIYRVARAEQSGLESASTDIVTVAQALHWLDCDSFYREVKRVLTPGGVIAAWCYSLVEIDPLVDPVVRRFYQETVGPYWSPERRLVDEGYRTIDFPFDEFELPSLAIEQSLTLDQFAGYVRTWSATQRYLDNTGLDPVAALLAEIEPLWGDATSARYARWPLSVRAGFHDK